MFYCHICSCCFAITEENYRSLKQYLLHLIPKCRSLTLAVTLSNHFEIGLSEYKTDFLPHVHQDEVLNCVSWRLGFINQILMFFSKKNYGYDKHFQIDSFTNNCSFYTKFQTNPGYPLSSTNIGIRR